MNNIIYEKAKEFKRKYPNTIAFRIRKHAKVASKFIGDDEEIKYVFLAQKNNHTTEKIEYLNKYSNAFEQEYEKLHCCIQLLL